MGEVKKAYPVFCNVFFVCLYCGLHFFVPSWVGCGGQLYGSRLGCARLHHDNSGKEANFLFQTPQHSHCFLPSSILFRWLSNGRLRFIFDFLYTS